MKSRMPAACVHEKDFSLRFLAVPGMDVGAGTSSSSSFPHIFMSAALPEHLRNDPSIAERLQTDMARVRQRATLISLVEQGAIGVQDARENGLSEEDLSLLGEFPDRVTLPASGGHVSGAGSLGSHSSGARKAGIKHWLLDCLRDCSCCRWCSGS